MMNYRSDIWATSVSKLVKLILLLTCFGLSSPSTWHNRIGACIRQLEISTAFSRSGGHRFYIKSPGRCVGCPGRNERRIVSSRGGAVNGSVSKAFFDGMRVGVLSTAEQHGWRWRGVQR